MKRNKEPEVISFPNIKGLDATRKDLLVEIDGEKIWVPQAVIHDDSEVWRKDDEGTLILQEWWVVESGIFGPVPEEEDEDGTG